MDRWGKRELERLMFNLSQDSPTALPVAPSQSSFNKQPSLAPATNMVAASWWHDFGFMVYPVRPGRKIPAYQNLPSWLECYSREKVQKHWTKNPSHDIGIRIPVGVIALDTDNSKGTIALNRIFEEYGIVPNLVESTTQGGHYLLRLKEGTYAPSDTSSTEDHPQFIDVLTTRRNLVVSPSTGKDLVVCEAQSINDLIEVDQGFIDSLFLMNGRRVPQRPEPRHEPRPRAGSSDSKLETIATLSAPIDPDLDYEYWLSALAAIFHETSGRDEGLSLANRWSSAGRKYKGLREIRQKWRSFRLDHPTPCTIGTLFWLVQQNGGDPAEIMDLLEPDFDVIDKEGEAQ
jgi:hypothetical protein